MTEDLGTTPRKPLTPTQRLKMFEDHKGICALCGQKIEAGEKWIDEHLRALGLSGSNDLENRAPAHVACAAVKTKGDIQRIAKAKRQKMSALGLKQSANPMPCGRNSRFKKTMAGKVVDRLTGEEIGGRR